MSNVLSNTLNIENYKGLYIKNTVGLKVKKLSPKDYKAFNGEKELHFVMSITNPIRIRRNLTPIKIIGMHVDTAISLANEEKTQIIGNAKNGIHPKSSPKETDDLITIERLWNEYLAHKLNEKTMTESYAKNCTYYFNKHMKPFFMPYKAQKKEVRFNIRVKNEKTKKYEFKEIKEIQEIPFKDPITRQLIIDEKKVVDIRHITETMLNERMTALNNGCYTRKRVDPETKMEYIESIPYKPATAHQFIKAFQPMFEFARKKKYILENPMKDINPPTYENSRDFNISEQKQKELYNALMTYPELKFRAIFMFLLNGRRKNEVLKLTWNDIDFDTMSYHVQYYNSKNKKGSTYVLPQHIADTLMFVGGERKGYVFKSDRTGEKIDNFDKRWNAILKDLNLSGITRHDIRHWIGNLAINSGRTTSEVAYVLGHADDRTVKRYAKTRKESAARVNNFFHEHYSK